MRLWHGVILGLVFLTVIPLSACQYLGWGQQQGYSEEQIKAIEEYNQKVREWQEQQEEYQKRVVEAYNQSLNETYKQYSEGLTEYYEQRQKNIEEAVKGSDNQTP